MYFIEQCENPSYFYDFQIDVEEQITNIFWADAQMINDYGYFAMSSHLTRHTRQQTRIIDHWEYVGVNNLKQTIVFGATLLYDETIPSFEWLFETFLKAIGGKKPKTILTDQDAAMAKAFSIVMPETFHGLCTIGILEKML